MENDRNDNSIEKEILDNRGNSNVDDDDVKMIRPKKLKSRKNYVQKVDKIAPKNFKKRRMVLLIICLAIVSFSFVIGGSFAQLTNVSQTNNTAKLEAGVMKLEFSNGSKTISLSNALPQLDTDALVNNEEYSFTLANTGNVPAAYVLNLDNACSTSEKYSINEKEVKPNLCIPDKYIKVGLSINGKDYTILTRDDAIDAFILENGILEAGASNSYKLKIWLSVDTPNEYNAKGNKVVLYAGNLSVDYNQIENNTLDNVTQSNVSQNNSLDGVE